MLVPLMVPDPKESDSLPPVDPTKNAKSSPSPPLEKNHIISYQGNEIPNYISGKSIPRSIIREMKSLNDNNNNNLVSFEQVVVDRFIGNLGVDLPKIDSITFFDVAGEFLPIFQNRLFLKCLFEILAKYRSLTGPMAKKLLHKNGITKDIKTIRKYLDQFTETLGVCNRIKSNETDLDLPTLKPVDFIIYTIDNDFSHLTKYYGKKTEQKTDRYIRTLDSKNRKQQLAKKAKKKRILEDRLNHLDKQMDDNTLDMFFRRNLEKRREELQQELEGLDD